MNKESELTVSASLNQMYELGIDHAIEIVKDEFISTYGHSEVDICDIIIEKLQNLKAKG